MQTKIHCLPIVNKDTCYFQNMGGRMSEANLYYARFVKECIIAKYEVCRKSK